LWAEHFGCQLWPDLCWTFLIERRIFDIRLAPRSMTKAKGMSCQFGWSDQRIQSWPTVRDEANRSNENHWPKWNTQESKFTSQNCLSIVEKCLSIPDKEIASATVFESKPSECPLFKQFQNPVRRIENGSGRSALDFTEAHFRQCERQYTHKVGYSSKNVWAKSSDDQKYGKLIFYI
jgi:hypothetical protein